MRWATLLRTSYGVRLLPVTILIVVFSWQHDIEDPLYTQFSPAAEQLNKLLLLAAPVALSCALETRRYWTGGVLTHHQARSTPRILALPLILAIAPSLLLIAAIILSYQASDLWMLVVVGEVWTLAWASVGILLGITCRLTVSVPLVLAAPILLVLYGPAVPVISLRYLFGYYADCCTADTSIDTRAIQAGVIFGAGILLTSWILIVASLGKTAPKPLPGLVALVVGALAFGGIAATRVHGMDAQPTVPRTGEQVCTTATPRTCMWPEHQERLETTSRTVTSVTATWKKLGIATPTQVSEGATAATPDTIRWSPYPAATTEQAAYDLSFAMAYAPCQSSRYGASSSIAEDQERAATWLFVHSGQYHPGSTDVSLDHDSLTWVASLAGASQADQVARVTTLIDTVRACR